MIGPACGQLVDVQSVSRETYRPPSHLNRQVELFRISQNNVSRETSEGFTSSDCFT